MKVSIRTGSGQEYLLSLFNNCCELFRREHPRFDNLTGKDAEHQWQMITKEAADLRQISIYALETCSTIRLDSIEEALPSSFVIDDEDLLLAHQDSRIEHRSI